MTTLSPIPPTTDLQLHEAAQRFLNALLDSADVRQVGVARWWERAKTALETAAASSTSWRQCVSRAGNKLQIDVFTAGSAAIIAELAQHLDDESIFVRWRALATRDALTITAMVRHQRSTQRAATTAPTPTSEDAR
jgi:hypothetical protein